MNVENQVKNILVGIVENQIAFDSINDDTDLIDEVGLDSLRLINFILMLEDTFEIEIDFDDIEYEMFKRFGLIVKFIEGRVSE